MDLTNKLFDKIKLRTQQEKFEILAKYYKGEHLILNRQKDADLKNNKVVINNASYITDTNVGYIVGNPVQYQADEEFNESLISIIKEYEKQAINKIDTVVARHLSIYGVAYEYIYAKPNTITGIDFKSAVLSPTNAYVETDKSVEENPLWACFWVLRDNSLESDNNDTYYDVTLIDDKEIKMYVSKNNNLTFDETRSHKHFFGKVPLFKYKNNDFESGDFEKVKTIIDALNMLQSDRINDKEQLVSAILAIYGATVDDDDMKDLKTNRVIMMPDGSKAEYLIKALNEGEIEVLKKSLENDLHKISMTPNMSDENFASNQSGVALGYKLLPFEQNAKNKISFMEKGLEYRLECYSNALYFLNRTKEVLTSDMIDVIFTLNLPVNLLENAQIVSLLNGIVDQKTLLSTLPFVKDIEGTLEALKEESKQKSLMFGFNNQPFNKLDDENESN